VIYLRRLPLNTLDSLHLALVSSITLVTEPSEVVFIAAAPYEQAIGSQAFKKTK